MDQLKTQLEYIRKFQFIKYLTDTGLKVYLVGGAVRDGFLGLPVKDLDLLVVGIEVEKLKFILREFGQTDFVGESFGVLKFRPTEKPDEEFDIAVPRTERKVGSGHQGFEVNTVGVTLEQDLFRRDFTINSMAVDVITEDLVDPYNGIEDLLASSIRLTNPKAFTEDPLRMLRAVQFSARFGFIIEWNTLQAIKDNAFAIDEISGERVLGELDKLVKKGDVAAGVLIMNYTGLWEQISGHGLDYINMGISTSAFGFVETVAELVYFLGCFDVLYEQRDPMKLWKGRLKGDLAGAGEIEALQFLNLQPFNSKGDRYYAFYEAFKKSSRILVTRMINPDLYDVQVAFKLKQVPQGLQDVKINGEDLLALGYQGKVIGQALKRALWGIYEGEVVNEREALLAFVKGSYSPSTLHENSEIDADKPTGTTSA